MDTQKQIVDLLDSGFTQQKLADLVPCSQSIISAYVRGVRGKRPSMHIGLRIAALHKKHCRRRVQ